jgi:chromosome segregation ATPase
MANSHPLKPTPRPAPAANEGSKPNTHNDSFHSRILRLHEEKQGMDAGLLELSERGAALGESGEVDLTQQVEKLLRENHQLRLSAEQAKQRLAQSERTVEQCRAREQEYESLLEEKSEVIRQLHGQIQHTGPQKSAAEIPNEEELIALHQELEREREQLKQDEEHLMAQIRDMEVSMARERADMARQRSELMRLQNELKHQLEQASKDAAMRERLAPLFKLQEDIQRRRSPMQSR